MVDGIHVLTKEFQEVKELESKPKSFTQKLILGAREYGGRWFSTSVRVTNVDLFSSPLPIEKMKRMTSGESCPEEGDYLAWGEMEWILHGRARIETVEKERPCEGEPLANLYYTTFPEMDSCMHHCKKLCSRVPPVTTVEEWATLQTFLKKKLYDKGLNTLELWLPVQDKDIEGVWKDYYDGSILENYTIPWVGSKPDGGTLENCARLADLNKWGDINCDFPAACLCSQKPGTLLKLRGLCPNSAIDLYYKPMNNWRDSRKLRLQGLTHSTITYDKERKIWTIVVPGSDLNVTGMSRASFASFAMGKHNWTIEGDLDSQEWNSDFGPG